MLSTPVGRFRVIAFVEGLSALALFLVAMPIKHVKALGEYEQPTRIVGSIHGGLVILFGVAGILAYRARAWRWPAAVWGFVASVVPGATFVYDHLFLKAEHRKELAERAIGKDFASTVPHGK